MKLKSAWVAVALFVPFVSSMAQTTEETKGTESQVAAIATDTAQVVRDMAVGTVSVIEAPQDSVSAADVAEEVIDSQDRVDTLYYDKNWRVIKSKPFASYYRIALYPADSLMGKKSRTFYMSGEPEGEGDFVELSGSDDKLSIFTGPYVHYYKSGKPSCTCNYRDGILEGDYCLYNEAGKPTEKGAYKQGVLHGEQIIYFDNGTPSKVTHYDEGKLSGPCITYYESGLIHEHTFMRDGKRDGIESIFSENGEVCTQSLYEADVRAGQYIVTDKRGNCTLYNVADNSPVYVAPKEEEMKTEYKNGVAWPYYSVNGLIIGVSQVENDDIGSYKELQFFLSNNSMNNVDLDPATIVVYSQKKDDRKVMEVLDSENYDKKVYKQKTKTAKAIVKNKPVVEVEKQNNLNSNLGATMFDEVQNTLHDFQQRMIGKTELTQNTHILADNKVEDIGYLKRTTVHPSESVSGYLFINDKRMDYLIVEVTVNGILYPYKWDLRKKK